MPSQADSRAITAIQRISLTKTSPGPSWLTCQNRSPPTPPPAQAASHKKRAAIEAAAQAVLDARASVPGASLADLYDPLAMPPALRKAHHHLDKAADAAYAYKGQHDDASRVAFLFGLYAQMTSALALQGDQPNKRISAKHFHA